MAVTIEDRLANALETVAQPLAPARAALLVEAPGLGISSRSGEAALPFRIASLTKPFLAATVHRLCEEGLLTLAVRVADVASGSTVRCLADAGYDPARITIGHLLAHVSGLFDHTEATAYGAAVAADPRRRWTRGEQIAFAMREGQPRGDPGEIYAYSDTGFILLGEIVEQVAGMSLPQAMRTLLRFEELGLVKTWWESLETPPMGLSALERQWHGDLDATSWDCSFDLFGGGGLVSTVGDLNRFLRALLGGKILRPDTLSLALATPPVAPAPGTSPGRTHSTLLATIPVGTAWGIGHTGFWSSIMVRLPIAEATVSLSLNRAGDEARRALMWLLTEIDAIVMSEWRARHSTARL